MVCFMVTLINAVSCVSLYGMVHGYTSDKTYRITTVETLLSIQMFNNLAACKEL